MVAVESEYVWFLFVSWGFKSSWIGCMTTHIVRRLKPLSTIWVEWISSARAILRNTKCHWKTRDDSWETIPYLRELYYHICLVLHLLYIAYSKNSYTSILKINLLSPKTSKATKANYRKIVFSSGNHLLDLSFCLYVPCSLLHSHKTISLWELFSQPFSAPAIHTTQPHKHHKRNVTSNGEFRIKYPE